MAASKGDGPAIGIDLGTTYSCVAVWRGDRGEVIANDQGNRLTPSCVAFTATESLVGEAAVNQAALNPTNTVFGEKNSMHACCKPTAVQHHLDSRHVLLITHHKAAFPGLAGDWLLRPPSAAVLL
ncbi:hypothetical protein ACP70R_013899 [Stipagrostis hirtigluma subsp. patula]